VLRNQSPPSGVPDEAREAYDALAPHYDAYTHHAHYDIWVREIAQLAAAHGARRGRLLDLGCGTGSSLGPMVDDGWRAVGCDVSERMLGIARARIPDAEFVRADIRDLPDLGTFDLVWALNDPINYLTRYRDVLGAFAGAGRALGDGGVFVFDANTELGYRTGFLGSHTRDVHGVDVTWDGAAQGRQLYRAELRIQDRTTGAELTSFHRQRCHAMDELHAAVGTVGLRVRQTAGQLPDGALEPELDERRHVRAVFFVDRDPEGGEPC
jgi:SAM-dependent methyltransferase